MNLIKSWHRPSTMRMTVAGMASFKERALEEHFFKNGDPILDGNRIYQADMFSNHQVDSVVAGGSSSSSGSTPRSSFHQGAQPGVSVRFADLDGVLL